MGPLTRLYKRLRQGADKVGLELKDFEARPHPDSEKGPHRVRAFFTLKEDFNPNPKPPDELDAMLEAQRVEAERVREEQARAGLQQLMKNLEEGGGIL